MDDQRVGSVLRALRRRRGWTQADVAGATHISQPTVHRLEAGHLESVALGTLRRVAAVLEVRLELTPRWRGGELDRIQNARHAAATEAVARSLDTHGWASIPEATFAIYGERGSIDLLAWHAGAGALLVVEVKTEIVDVQDLLAGVDRKRRLAPRVAAEHGWPRAVSVSAWVAVAESRTNRRRLAAHRTLLRGAFPADGRVMGAWLRQPNGAVAALSFLPDTHARNVGHSGGGSRRVRGRRSPPR